MIITFLFGGTETHKQNNHRKATDDKQHLLTEIVGAVTPANVIQIEQVVLFQNKAAFLFHLLISGQ